MSKPSENVFPRLLPFLLVAILSVAVAAVGIVGFTYYSHFSGEIVPDHSRWGQFGDFFGGTLNPLLAFLGLIALLITLVIQSRELGLSTRELANSAKALSEQSQSLKKQNFESTFFEMVKLLNSIVQDLDLGEKVKGRDCFKVFYRTRLRGQFGVKSLPTPIQNENLKRIRVAYGAFFGANQQEIGHYFRTLYRIYKYLDEEAPEERKTMYAGIIRAQLSSYELDLLFYNCLHDVGEKFKPLVERYAVFENMAVDDLLDKDNHIPLYDKAAFGDHPQSAQA